MADERRQHYLAGNNYDTTRLRRVVPDTQDESRDYRFLLRRMRFAFSSSRRRSTGKFFPARLIKNWTIFIAEPSPAGDTSLRAMISATSSPFLAKVPSGGKVELVFTSFDHFRGDAALLDLDLAAITFLNKKVMPAESFLLNLV